MTTMTLRVLSADAPKVGLRNACRLFTVRTGRDVDIALMTAPLIEERVKAGRADADIVIVPKPVLDRLAAASWIQPDSIIPVGAVVVGVVVRDGTPDPDLSSPDAFREAILRAEAVVYNKASSGVFAAEMLERLGVAAAIADRVVVVATGAAVMEHLAEDPRRAIGFGHVTEIRLHNDRGTHLVGPLPSGIGRATVYAAGIVANGPYPKPAGELIAWLASPDGKRLFVASGVL